MGRLHKGILIAVVVVVIGIAAVFLFQMPSAGVQDRGDWGTVSDNRVEVITTVWVQNPNPLGVRLGKHIDQSYSLYMNDINVANGEKSNIEIAPGNNTVQFSTYIRTQTLSEWWVKFIKNNETISIRVTGQTDIAIGPLTTSHQFSPFQQTVLSDSTPIINSLSQAAASTEGNYTLARQGYEIRKGWATWGEVNEDTTTVLFHFNIHNPGSVRVPTPEPDGLEVNIDMNGIRLFEAQSDEFSLRNSGPDFIQPGETEEVVIAVEMDNSKVDDWFKSHVKNKEQTKINTSLQLSLSANGRTIEIPEGGVPVYSCRFQTAILVDGKQTETNCGEPGSLPGVEQENDSESDTSKETETPTDIPITSPTVTPTDTPTNTPTDTPACPTAVADASPRSGEAPLEVDFDGSGSSDPNNDIEQYIWRFKDGSPPARGKTVTHTFRTAGTYYVELVVVDSQGCRDTDIVEITVESRVG